MIQIRKSNGEVVPVPEGCFVELVNDAEPHILNTVFYQQNPHTVVQVLPDSPEALRYAGLFSKKGITFCKTFISRDHRHD